MLLAGVVGGKFALLALALSWHSNNSYPSVSYFKRGFNGVSKAWANIATHYKTVNNDVYIMLFCQLKLNVLIKVINYSVNTHSCVSAFPCVGKDLFVSSLFTADNGGNYHKALSLAHCQDFINDLVNALLLYFPSALGAMDCAKARIKKPQVVVNLGYGADG